MVPTNIASLLFLVLSIQAEAQINPDVVRGLIPHVNIMNSYLDRLFPGDEASEVHLHNEFYIPFDCIY